MLIGFMFIVEKSFDFHIVLLYKPKKGYTDKIPTYSTPGVKRLWRRQVTAHQAALFT